MKLLEIGNTVDIKEYLQVWSVSLFDKKIESEVSANEQLAKELHKPVIKKFKRKKNLSEI